MSTLPAGIQPFVEAYEQSLVWEPFVGDNPYLFPLASSHQYGQSSSGWTQLVKSVFERYAGVPVPPKQVCCASNVWKADPPSSSASKADPPPLLVHS